MEEIISGYCRAIDCARTVFVDTEEQCADCDWPECLHSAECPVAEKIRRLLAAD